jgi:hypothetical protein
MHFGPISKGYMGITQDSIDLKLKSMSFSLHIFFLPWHFFKINDAKSQILFEFKPCGVSFVILSCKPIAMAPLEKGKI